MSPDHLSQLLSIMPVPRQPIGIPTPDDWQRVEAELGLRLPADYKAFVGAYGAGIINDHIRCVNPAYPEDSPFVDPLRLEVYGGWAEAGETPHPIYPAPGGLLPWGTTGNGDSYFWVTEPADEPDRWPIAIFDRGDPSHWLSHPGPMTRLLVEALEQSFALPGSMRLSLPPEFTPFGSMGWGGFSEHSLGVWWPYMYGETDDGPLIVWYLGRSKHPERVRDVIASTGVVPPTELLLPYAQANGVREDRWVRWLAMHATDRPATALSTLEFAPGLRFPSDELAAELYAELRATRPGWHEDWWPLLIAPDGRFAVECRGGDRGRVLFVPLGDEGAAQVRYDNVEELFGVIVARFESGAWAWSDTEWRFHAEPGSDL